MLRGFASITVECSLGLVTRSTRANARYKRIFAINNYGAIGDGTASCTSAIQKAIDAASAVGGGVVLVPAGRYVTGTILLRSNVTLSLSAEAILQGSLDPADYHLVEPFIDGVGTARGYALIACVDARNVGIRGLGTIDGRGAALQAAAGVAGAKLPSAKPFLILSVRSRHIEIKEVRLLNSSAWTVHIFQCADVVVSQVSLRSVGLANNDGIDIDSSERVLIENCKIESDDDSICLKTTSIKSCRDITIKNCTLSTRCAAIKLGTESAGDFDNIRVSDCHVIRANLGAIKLLSVDGANIRKVLVERVTVEDVDTPIFIRLGARSRTYRTGDTPRMPGTICKIAVRDIVVLRARRIGILICGLPKHPVDGVSFEHISITMAGEPVRYLPVEPAENPAAYPEIDMFGIDLPASKIYGRHLRGIHFKNITVTGVAGDVRPVQMLSDSTA